MTLTETSGTTATVRRHSVDSCGVERGLFQAVQRLMNERQRRDTRRQPDAGLGRDPPGRRDVVGKAWPEVSLQGPYMLLRRRFSCPSDAKVPTRHGLQGPPSGGWPLAPTTQTESGTLGKPPCPFASLSSSAGVLSA